VEPFLIGALSKSLRRPLLRRSEVKKPKNDEVHRLGNYPLPSTKREAVLWRGRYRWSIKFDVSPVCNLADDGDVLSPGLRIHDRNSDLLKVPVGRYEVP